MKINRRKGGEDGSRILTAMITDADVLGVIADRWKDLSPQHSPGPFKSKWSNQIAQWCVDYHRKYKKAPNRQIEDIFREWAEKTKDEGTVDLIDKYLSALNQEYESNGKPKDSDYLLDLAEDHFKVVQLKRLADEIEDELHRKDIGKASDLVNSFEEFNLRDNLDCPSGVEFELTSTRWLWKGWLAYENLTLFDGEKGHGKSTILIDVAARVSRGWKMPPHPRGEKNGRRPRNVMILDAGENDWTATTLPRFIAAGGDVARVKNPGETTDGSEPPDIWFPKSFGFVERFIKHHKISFVIIDPIMGFLTEKTESNSGTPVRRLLRGLRGIAKRTGVSIAMIRHHRKSGGKATDKGLGSIEWTNFCRVQNTVGEIDGKKVLACSANNLMKNPASLAYTLEGCTVKAKEKNGAKRNKNKKSSKKKLPYAPSIRKIETSKAQWIGPVEVTANQLVAAAAQRGRPSKTDDICEYIKEVLHENGGEMDSNDLKELVLNELSISERTYRTARKNAGVKSIRIGFGEGSRCITSLRE